MNKTSGISLRLLSDLFGGKVFGDAELEVTGIRPLAKAQKGEISFLTNSRYRDLLLNTQASAVILGPDDQNATDLARIVVANPYVYMAKVSAYFHPMSQQAPGIHPSAIIHENAVVSSGASIGANAIVGNGARILSGVRIGEQCVIGEAVIVDESSMLYPNVSIYPGCKIGKHCIIHSGVVIGSDGFGIAKEGQQWIKIPQVGAVQIGDHVEIGANTTIDRGTFEDTVIEDGVKLDNQIQVAHNVHIGAHTAIAACAGIAGSARIGKHCMIGGAAMIVGHLEIADHCVISAGTMVTKSIAQPDTYSGMWAAMPQREWNKQVVRLRRLEDIENKVKMLEQKMNRAEGKES